MPQLQHPIDVPTQLQVERIGSPSVLVIDDDELTLTFERWVLQDAGYRVTVASSGGDGLTLFESLRPDCVLLDVRMPGLSGIETCRRLRALPEGRNVPVVFLTALGNLDTFDWAFECGADDFIRKPVSPTTLLDHVHVAINLRQARPVRDCASSLKAERDALLRQQLQTERFSALLVHDLKAPLNTIGLLAQSLLRGGSLHSPDVEAVEDIRAQVRRLTTMATDLLDISKAREGKLTAASASVDVRELVSSVVADFAANARQRGVTVEGLIFASKIYADVNLLRRALVNLVDNALRHAPPGTAVTLTASPRVGFTELRITDEGCGIAEAGREAVFEAFTQLEPGNVSGRGLGLAFCKLVASAHGGRIWIEDACPGAAICVALPDTQQEVPEQVAFLPQRIDQAPPSSQRAQAL